MSKSLKLCENCKANVRHYADGYILKDWTKFSGDIDALTKEPDQSKFWTYQECKKNSKGLKFLNLMGDCQGFEKK